MPKNKGKGGKNFKKGKKGEGDDTRRDLIFKEDGQGKFNFEINILEYIKIIPIFRFYKNMLKW
jgi:hypothetical protein